jgi:hypothetical protein
LRRSAKIVEGNFADSIKLSIFADEFESDEVNEEAAALSGLEINEPEFDNITLYVCVE